MEPSEYRPPRILLTFFRWYCHPGIREEIEGDLLERFHNYSKQYGQDKAKWFFIKEVLLLFRPSIIGNIYPLTKKNRIFMIMQNKRLIGIAFTVALLLLIPLIAMKVTNDVNWTLFDFIVAGVLLLGTGLMCELIMRKVKKTNHRIAICVALLATLLLIWTELAVGIFD